MTSRATRRLGVVVVVTAVAGPAWAAGPDPALAVSPPMIDAGAVEIVNAAAAATIHLTNTGTGPLRLLDVQIVDAGTGAAADWAYTATLPCGAHIPDTCELATNQGVDLDLAFDPSAIGVRDATLLINYHDVADRSISVPLHAIGRGPTLELVGGQTILDFGTLPIGATGQLAFRVVNRGTRNLADGLLTALPPGPFAIAPGPSFTVATTAPTTFTVACTPTAAGPATADVQLSAPDVQSPPIELTLRCAGDTKLALTSMPSAIQLGEVRVGSSSVAPFTIASTAAPTTITAAALATANPALGLAGAPAPTPAALQLTATPTDDGSLANHVVVTPATGTALDVPITGTAVTASYAAPDAVSLGTFCVNQPTTPRILSLVVDGTATIGVSAPALARTGSPFALTLVAPLTYPTTLPPGRASLVALTPAPSAVAGLASDTLVWTTDVAGATTKQTKITAAFADNGGAIAPPSISFGNAPIHLDLRNAQQVTLQNCDVSPLQLDSPQIASPFSIDSPNFPAQLRPGETATLSVGFHPTKVDSFAKTLTITSPQLHDPLTVQLSGNGVATGGSGDGGITSSSDGPTSFYACTGCTSGSPSGAAAIVFAAIAVLARRRR